METATITVPTHGPPWEEALAVVATLRAHGAQAWFVGGCVRDLLLSRAVQDVDIATDAPPERVEGWFPQTVAVGKSFGVMIVVTPSGANVEVATFRSDGAYIDGRRPTSVIAADARTDVERRDFTINALLLDPLTGAVIDHVGGLADLRERRLRGIGDAAARLREDRLRVLRGLRFAAALQFEFEAPTWEAIRTTELTGLSGERIVQEWFKGLGNEHRGRWLSLLADSGRLEEFTPPLHADMATPTAGRLDRLGVGSEDVAAATWLSLAPAAETDEWVERMPFEKAFTRRVRWLLEQLRALPFHAGRSIAARRRLAQHPQSGDLGQLARACQPDDPGTCAFASDLEAERARPRFVPWVRAGDLLALGLPAGPRVGSMLRQLEDAQLEDRLPTRERALEQAREWLVGGP